MLRAAGISIALTVLCQAAAVPANGQASSALAPQAALETARESLYAHIDDAKRFLGPDTANDVVLRVNSDLETRDADRPADFPRDAWDEAVADIERLDLSLVDQALSAKPRPFGEIRGLGETLVRVRSDDTYQPVAVYVPTTYVPGRNVPAIVALHGRPQTESELLGPPWLRKFAEKSGAIVIAPWGRGLYDFADPAGGEVYEALDAAEAGLSIDAHRVYLVGYSMGGFSVFKVAPLHGERWAGVMSIAGAVLNSEMPSVTKNLRNVPIYVVNGSDDAEIPPKYGDDTAQALVAAGLRAGFYQQLHGNHFLRTLGPALDDAWSDMLRGVVHPRRPLVAPESTPPPGSPRRPD